MRRLIGSVLFFFVAIALSFDQLAIAAPQTRDGLPATRFSTLQPTAIATHDFAILAPVSCPCTLRVVNGPERVGAAWIWIDDLEVLAPPALTPAIGSLEVPLNLQRGTHRLRVRLTGPAGSSVLVSVSGTIDLPDMPAARSGHRAVTLGDGTVRLVGGSDSAALATDAIDFNAATLQWQTMAWSARPRSGAAVTLTPDNGLLAIGGERNGATNDADFVTDTGASLAAPSLATARAGHSITPLSDGRFLVLGGRDVDGTVSSSSEVFDPRPDPFTDAVFDTVRATVLPLPLSLQTPRSDHTATRLPDGRVLVVGGRSIDGPLAAIELVDPRNATSALLPIALQHARAGHSAVMLADGRIVIAGGAGAAGFLASVEVIAADLSAVTLAPPTLARARAAHSASLMPWGDVLIAGGTTDAGPTAHTELIAIMSEPPAAAPGFAPSPAHGAIDIDRGAIATLAFSVPVDPASVSAAVTMTANGVAISSHVVVLEDGALIAVMPMSVLPAGAAVQISVDGARDRSGAALPPVSWSFTVVAPPVITSLEPTHGIPGTSVLVQGESLPTTTSDVRLLLGDLAVVPVSSSPTQLEFVVPHEALPGSAAVQVTTRGGRAANAPLFEVEPVVTGPTPVAIEIYPRGNSLSVGGTQTFTATARYEDGSHRDVTQDGRWTSSAPDVAGVANGVANAATPGTADISVAIGSLSATATLKVYDGEAIPADPSLVATPIDQTSSTRFESANRFLFEGENPIQRDVAPAAIEDRRIAVVRGRVTAVDGSALEGARISISGHPEFGYTLSRQDGAFDLAVNGGGVLTLRVERSGYLLAERQTVPNWRQFMMLEPIALVSLDPVATPVDLATIATPAVARGSVVEDDDGARQATLVFSPGTVASVTLPDGTTQELSTITVRATEYTVGPHGEQAMPAPLPATSAYTYAVEFSVDELAALGVRDVSFSKPVAAYTDNFLMFPAGTPVPLAYYDRDRHAWIPQPDGRVIEVLSEAGGLAELDVTGSGTPSSTTALDALGITAEERQTIASLYEPGQSVWRVQVDHFSPYDFNWPQRPPPNSGPPNNGPPNGGTNEDLDEDECKTGSLIECQSQNIGEDIPIVGTGVTLNYRSSRVPRRRSAYTISGQVIGSTVPPNVKRAELVIRIAGREFFYEYPAQPNQSYTFTWDGKDAYGREVQGTAEAVVDIGHVFDATYTEPASGGRSFGQAGASSITASATRNEVTYWQTHRATLGTLALGAAEGNGWSLSAHHVYDPNSLMIYYGTGLRHSVQNMPLSLSTVAGRALQGGQNIPLPPSPATQLTLTRPQGMVANADGSFLLTNGTSTGQPLETYRVQPNGAVATVADASFGVVRAVGADGTLYFVHATRHIVRAKYADGSDAIVAGRDGLAGFAGDGGLATAALLNGPADVAVDRDGTLYIADRNNGRVRRVAPDGYISTVAGGGLRSLSSVDQPALDIFISSLNGVAIAPSGRVLVAYSNRLAQLNTDGTMRGLVGNILTAQDVDVAWDGTVYVTQVFSGSGVVYRLDTAGTLTTVASSTVVPTEKGPAINSLTLSPRALAVSPDGSVLILSGSDVASISGRVARMGRPRTNDPTRPLDLLVPSSDGSEVFAFDPNGRHLSTFDAMTGLTKLRFNYDEEGRLTSITDKDDQTLTLERSGVRLQAIVSPNGLRTTITTSDAGLIETIDQPGGGTWRLVYNSEGLLASMRRPGGQTSVFTYEDGRLVRDDDGIGFTTLTSTRANRSWTAFTTTAEGRQESFLVERLSNGSIRRTNTNAAGLRTIVTAEEGGRQIQLAPDGTRTTMTPSADPRWGTQVKFPQFVDVDMPGLPRFTVTTQKFTRLSDPGNPLSVSDDHYETRLGLRTVYSRVYTGALRRLTESDGSFALSMYFDADNRIVQMQQPNTTATLFEYNDAGQVSRLVQGARTTEITHDARQRPERVTDAYGRSVRFSYDSNGRVTSETLQDEETVQFSYDADGNLLSLTPPGKPAHRFTYTPLGLLESYTPPDTSESGATGFRYNRDRQLVGIDRPDAPPIAFSYDGGGRLSSTSFGDSLLEYDYDSGGHLAKMQLNDGATVQHDYAGSLRVRDAWTGPVTGEVTRTYSPEMRVRTERVNGGYAVTYSYDNGYLVGGANGLSISRTYGLPTWLSMDSLTESIQYNAFGETLSRSTLRFGYQQFLRSDYTYDNLGRITQIIETVDGIMRLFAYTYDARGRLESVRRNGDLVVSYTYDANGNRLTVSGEAGLVESTYDSQDRLLSQGDVEYRYTPTGEVAEKIAGAARTRYEYDALGNLKRVFLPDGRVIRYVLDGRGRRVQKLIDDVPVRGWLWSSELRPIAELDAAGAVRMRFVYGSRGNVPDFIMKDDANFRILSDQRGSPRVVVDSVTGEIVQRLDYGAFGELVQDSSPGWQPFGFAGGLYDPDTGLVHLGARDYDPRTGRWWSKDPSGFAGGDSNLYAYAGNDPVNALDVNGNEGITLTDVANFSAGLGDALLMGFGDELRDAAGIEGVDMCSAAYKGGQIASLAAGLGRLGYAGAAKAVSMMPRVTGAGASAARNTLKSVFRGGLFPNYRAYSYEQMLAKYGSDAAVKAAAGRTNNALNAVGAGAAAGAAASGSECPCK